MVLFDFSFEFENLERGSIMVDMLNIVRECNCDNANKMNVKKITTSRS